MHYFLLFYITFMYCSSTLVIIFIKLKLMLGASNRHHLPSTPTFYVYMNYISEAWSTNIKDMIQMIQAWNELYHNRMMMTTPRNEL